VSLRREGNGIREDDNIARIESGAVTGLQTRT
jgi:hypothetical protein